MNAMLEPAVHNEHRVDHEPLLLAARAEQDERAAREITELSWPELRVLEAPGVVELLAGHERVGVLKPDAVPRRRRLVVRLVQEARPIVDTLVIVLDDPRLRLPLSPEHDVGVALLAVCDIAAR